MESTYIAGIGTVQHLRRFLHIFGALVVAGVAFYDYPTVDPLNHPKNTPASELLPEYDFIVIGAGSAGAAIANRLSEIQNWTVLLLEFGKDENAISDTPLLSTFTPQTFIDWNYTTTPQKLTCGAYDGICITPRGKVIGGSSTLNDLVWMRGNRMDYDSWAAVGNPGWSYEDVLPYFLRLEDMRDHSARHSPYHGTSGPITINRSPFLSPMAQAFVNAGGEMGYQNVDIDGKSQIGFMINRGPLIKGRRCSTGRGYLRPIRNRTNLIVSESVLVVRIAIEPETKTANGVLLVDLNNTHYTIAARKEVILSAGAINSPQLLMLSGIGPSEELKKLSLPIFQDLRVGDNLQDHFGVMTLFSTNANVTLNLLNSYANQTAYFEYVQNGTGPLTSLNGIEAVGNMYNEYPPETPGLPDTGIQLGIFYGFNKAGNVFYGKPYYLHPSSRGTVRLASANPRVPPLIDPRYLTSEEDFRQAISSQKKIFDLVGTNALLQFGPAFHSSYTPRCPFNGNVTNDFIICLLKIYGYTAYDHCCTNKMGPSTDPTAVVDNRLRVHGINNLRVADASIMPTLISGNTNAASTMIGEMASDLIRADHGVPIGSLPPVPHIS